MRSGRKELARAETVAIVPYGTRFRSRLRDVPLDQLAWPLGRPEFAQTGIVADLDERVRLLCYPSSSLFFMTRFGVRTPVSVMIVEPSIVHARIYRWLKFLSWRFERILTFNKEFIGSSAKAVYSNPRYFWIDPDRKIDMTKTANLSIIASAKTQLPGHKLRHQVVDWIRSKGIDAAILGRGYKPFDEKHEGLAPYRYTVVIENSREQGYRSEKLLDALACKTIPIYWGAPDIGQEFEARGLILCETFEDLCRAIEYADEAGYEARRQFIEENWLRVMQQTDPEKHAASVLLASLNGQ